MANDPPEEVQRWTAKRRVALVVSILKGETSVPQAARKHGLTVAEIEDWQERFLLAAENGLRARPITLDLPSSMFRQRKHFSVGSRTARAGWADP